MISYVYMHVKKKKKKKKKSSKHLSLAQAGTVGGKIVGLIPQSLPRVSPFAAFSYLSTFPPPFQLPTVVLRERRWNSEER